MFALTRLRLLVTFGVVLAFAASLAFGVFSSTAPANHSWNGYHWARTDNPLALDVGDNLRGVWVLPFSYEDPNDNPAYDLTNADYLDTALSDWDQQDTSPVLRLTEVPGRSNPKKCRPTSGQVEVCNHRYGKTRWLGLTRIWLTSDGHIAQATSKLNDTYLSNPQRYPQYNNPVWRLGTLCHELGHTFGLAHQDENSCMDNVSNPSSEDMRPNAHDYEQLEAIYEHVDDTNTSNRVASETPAAPKDIDATDPAQEGRQIRKSGWEEDPFVLQVKVVKEEDQPQQERLQQQPQQSQPQHEQTQPQREQTQPQRSQPQHEQTQPQHEQPQQQRKQEGR